MTINQICSEFNILGKFVGVEQLDTGNINCTYKVTYQHNGDIKNYIIQKINTVVFVEPEKVMDNIVSVTRYIRQNLAQEGLSTKKFVLQAFPSKQNKEKAFIIDEDGNYWRCYRFIPNSITYDTCDNLEIIERAGSAFGMFQKYLDGYDAKSLNITIPNFHNTILRFVAFKNAIKEDKFNRVKSVQGEIDKLLSFEKTACILQEYIDNGQIPLRVTHNDTKCNNVSFDKTTGEPLAILDLDTVMPGAIAHDFGDAIRFVANAVIEDCPDEELVKFDLNKYEAFAKGFITKTKDMLTDLEKQTINLGVFTLAVELAVRFLTDYLNGDVYFKTKYPGHNLDRARNQIALAKDWLMKKELLNDIVKKYF